MKIAFISPANWFLELARELSKTHTVLINDYASDCDLLFCGSITLQEKAVEIHRMYPDIPVANYVWDLYEWVFTRPRIGEYNYKLYGEFLKESKFLFCPSIGTQKRIREFYGIGSHVLYTFVPVFESETKNCGYIYQPLREQPDRDWGMLDEVCKEIGIPLINHVQGYEQYKRVLSECRMVVSPLYEASTGSLSLVEGAYLGKPCLVSGSPYNGGSEYLPGVPTFSDREDLKKKLQQEIPHTKPRDFSVKRMADELCAYILLQVGT